MNLIQSYESVIRDPNSNLAARVMIIPRRSLASPTPVSTGSMDFYIPEEAEHIRRSLGAWHVAEISPDQLVPVVAAIVTEMPAISGEIIDTSFEEARAAMIDRLISAERSPFASDDLAFAKSLVYDQVVPFEQSPLGAVSLVDIAKAGGVATGAFVGFIVAGPTPLLLVTVPAGMIICGAAAGIGEGLRRRFESLLSGKGSKGD